MVQTAARIRDSEGGMTTQRRRGLYGDLRTTHTKKQPTANKYHARRFPIQHEIRKLEDELNSFNERIAELEDEGHRGHAMEVLKINALDFARRIDELRCILGPVDKGWQPKLSGSEA